MGSGMAQQPGMMGTPQGMMMQQQQQQQQTNMYNMGYMQQQPAQMAQVCMSDNCFPCPYKLQFFNGWRCFSLFTPYKTYSCKNKGTKSSCSSG